MTAPRSGPVTFGQLSVLRSLVVHGADHQAVANLADAWEVPPGVDHGQVVEAWLRLVETHESLRTTYDRSGARPVQIVQPMRFRRIPSVEVAEDSLAAVLRAAGERATEPISTEDLPWRVSVATYRGEPCGLAVVIHHVAADNAALTVLREHFARLLKGEPLGPVAQPLELADDQQRTARQTARHLQHWIEVWPGLVPADRDPADRGERRRASLYSASALAGAQRLAGDLRVSVQAVVLGAGALALVRRGKATPITFALMAANRLDPRWATLVSSLNQYAPLTVDVDEDAAPADFLKAVYMGSLGAYLNAGYDVDALAASLRRAGHPDPDPTAFAKHFNFLGDVQSEPAPDSPLGRGIEWRSSTQRSGPNFHLAAAAGATGLLIGVGASVDYLPGDQPAGVARAIEAGIVSMATGTPATLRDVLPEWQDEGR